MACPDRHKDAQIIAEIERRKAMQTQGSEEVFFWLEYEGLITDIQFMTDLDKVVFIEKTAHGRYRAKIKEL